MKEYAKKLLLFVFLFILIFFVFKGLFLLFSSELDYFLDHVFPDDATDDLDLAYVLDKLPSSFWYINWLIIGLLTVTLVLRKYQFLFICLLLVNVQTFILLRSNWEFSFWMRDAIHDYGGPFGGLIFLGFIASMLWLLIEIIDLIRSTTIKDSYSPTVFIKWIRRIGVAFTIVLSLVHFFPILLHTIRTFT
ncbi:hypothetical protein [Alkalihalobacillus sp. AL-G]|uniref:hypothetical protein n=1 Tax=Alkalihalobacillus sp. AL-G TaxID=2926399 RepID=UPI00272D74CD|nr:hypothetical protein [Alkalihalobacillus sp. AL-G]WLD93046.1 hypothetical protein MOJ78_18930 [Alkalihalobacillus sp. AL-G]